VCVKTAEPFEMPFVAAAGRLAFAQETIIRCGMYGRHQTNRVEVELSKSFDVRRT